MGRVEQAVRANVAAGTVLHTTARHKPFTVERYDDDGVVLLLGEGRHPVRVTWVCLEGVVGFLADQGFIEIGGQHISEGQPGTLDEHMKTCTKTNTARWVAVLLEAAGVVSLSVVPDRPVQVALI